MEKNSQILQILYEEGWHSREDLAQNLGLEEAELEEQLKILAQEHPQIRQVPELGVCLPQDPHRYDQKLLEALSGGPVEVHESLGSTNDVARERFGQGAGYGTAVLADYQTAGRGRMGRSFASPGGTGIYLSVLLTDSAVLEQSHLVTPAAAVVAVRALERLTRARIGIKWVNDLFCSGKKISGILTEAVVREGKPAGIIVGIGVNFATPPELLPEVAGSLRDFLLPGASRNEAAAALIRGLRDELPDLVRQRSFLPEYRRRSILLGQPVRVLPVGQEPYEAVAESIDEEAALVVDRQGRKIRLQTGEVSIRFPGQETNR